ncbi:MAG: GNAT family N-acetyltransferase [Steroidobacteraceae bacterium]
MLSESLLHARSAAEFSAARVLFREYAQLLGIDLTFQGFTAEVDALERMYGPPGGLLLLAPCGTDYLGCVGVRRVSNAACEMKRLYVRANARRAGLGRALAEGAIEAACALGYQRMLLDTLPEMDAAQRLYSALGFRRRGAYRRQTGPALIYMQLDLTRARPDAGADN